jgi:hypothetical protein
MAYVNQDEKKTLSVNIKKVLKKYGMKGSISIRHHSTLVVKIKSGKLDVIGNWFNKVTEYGNTNRYGDVITKPEYLDVNEYWIDEGYTGEVKDFLNELVDAMKGPNWFNNSDIQSDYFHLKHYTDIKIGTWNKPYQFEG